MANLSKERRDRMLNKLEELKKIHNDDVSIASLNEIENALREKKYGLVWEEHSEAVDDLLKENIPVLIEDPERRLCKDESMPWNFIIEGDNLQALYLLEKTHHGKVDCIYIDPPYNTGAKDWKYNNDYVGKEDSYRHSKWLSMMKSRLSIAKRLLNPKDSVLICTIDEKEYLHLGCLLEELFPEANIQMVSDVIHPSGVARTNQFSRVDEYLFFVALGDAKPAQTSDSMLDFEMTGDYGKAAGSSITWRRMIRAGSNSLRQHSENCFYPIFVDTTTDKIHSIGFPPGKGVDRNTVPTPEGCLAVWPIHINGDEGVWQISRPKLVDALNKGTARLGKKNRFGAYAMNYLSEGMVREIERGEISVLGKDENGALILERSTEKLLPAKSVWNKKSHDATQYGSYLVNGILGNKRFTYPKSLYSTHDAIKFYVDSNPNATIIDFFAGSGTTLHAINLLNAEDGGRRKCILVTNNEISETEEKDFIKNNPQSLKEDGSIDRDSSQFKRYQEQLGIATFVTWPRTVCSIEGQDINGIPLSGDYLVSDKNGDPIPMARGFNTNVKYLKCDWTPRKPEDYLLSNALCLHVKELIELHTSEEVDGIKNVLILSKSDYIRIFEDPNKYDMVENVWVNENLLFSSDEMRKLRAKRFHYIPREFFSQELKEVGEYV